MVFKSMNDAVKYVIDGYPVGHEFHGNQLKDAVVRLYPKARDTYGDTILRRLREFRRWNVVCIDPNKSKYRKIDPIMGKGISNGLDMRKKVKNG